MQTKHTGRDRMGPRQGIRSYRAQPDRHRHRGLCLLACCSGTVTNRPTIVRLKPVLCVVPGVWEQSGRALSSSSPLPWKPASHVPLYLFSGLLGA